MEKFDVIVVGAGTAGIPAALEAGARGLSVALVEAADDIGGTLHLSTASISAAGTSIQARNGIVDNVDAHFADYQRINHGTGRAPLVRRWMEEAAATIEWLISHGWSCNGDTAVLAPEHDLYSTPRTYRSKDLGIGVVAVFREALKKAIDGGARIDLRTGTRMNGFIVSDGAVTGIRATQDGQDIALSADAVILTTGGFTGSEAKWKEFHGINPLRYGLPTVIGDGIDAVRAIGGTTWFDSYLLPSFGGTRDIGGPPSAWVHSLMLPGHRMPWEIYVNLEGHRFMAEDEPQIFNREMAIKNQTDWGFWVIYDEKIRQEAPPLLRFTAEVAEEKFAGPDPDFVRADTIAELARAMHVPEDALAQSVELFNNGQAVGSDMLGRTHMPLPVNSAPYYAIRHFGFTISSYPGVRVDDDLAVVRADGSRIPGLYAAGEAIGIGFLGLGFLSGSIVSSAITFGRLLGRTVLSDQDIAA